MSDTFGFDSVLEEIMPILDGYGCYRRRELKACLRDAVPEAALATLCDQAVAALAARLEGQITAQRLDVLALEAGRIDRPAADPAATLHGAWTVRVEADGQVATGSAPFTAAPVAAR